MRFRWQNCQLYVTSQLQRQLLALYCYLRQHAAVYKLTLRCIAVCLLIGSVETTISLDQNWCIDRRSLYTPDTFSPAATSSSRSLNAAIHILSILSISLSLSLSLYVCVWYECQTPTGFTSVAGCPTVIDCFILINIITDKRILSWKLSRPIHKTYSQQRTRHRAKRNI